MEEYRRQLSPEQFDNGIKSNCIPWDILTEVHIKVLFKIYKCNGRFSTCVC